MKTFGDFKECSEAFAHGVYGFFNNGGSRCFVVNVGAPEASAAAPAKSADGKKDEAKAAQPAGPNRDGLATARTSARASAPASSASTRSTRSPWSRPRAAPRRRSRTRSCRTARPARIAFAILDLARAPSPAASTAVPKPRDSKYGAYYFPWIQVYDPDKGNIFVPPSGHIAGVYSRTDSERGVHKAPANEIARGALGLRHRVQGRAGTCSTLRASTRSASSTARSASGALHPVERPVVALHQRPPPVHHGGVVDRARTSGVVFEPNDHRLWKRVQRSISSFLTLLCGATAR
ncbi:MAG: phage tail sheath subtilisin-like domain-containing protein [Kofleriaceae bacterium]